MLAINNMKKPYFNKRNTIVFLSVLVIVSIFTTFSKTNNSDLKSETTTVAECVALSSEIRINERTKECFDKLSSEEFLSLYKSEENMKLYNEVGAYYDKRTDAEKAEDAKKTKAYFDEVTKNLENNPNAYKK